MCDLCGWVGITLEEGKWARGEGLRHTYNTCGAVSTVFHPVVRYPAASQVDCHLTLTPSIQRDSIRLSALCIQYWSIVIYAVHPA